MRTLRVAVVGAAGHPPYIVQGLKDMPEANLCAVSRGCPEEDLEAIRLKYDPDLKVPAYGDFREMLDRERPDVVASTPFFYLHEVVALEALRRGIPVFSEKPISITMEGLAALREVQSRADVPVGMMLDARYRPSLSAAYEIVHSGGIGDVSVGYCQKSYKHGTRPDFYRRRETFGGIIPWIGIHAIDWFRWVTGREYVSVTARHVKLNYPDYPDMEDGATCLFELDNGGSAVMSFDFLRAAAAKSHGDDRLRLAGDKGILDACGASMLEYIGPVDAPPAPEMKPQIGIFADFLRTVMDPSHKCRISTDDVFRITEVVLKARESADTGKKISL